MLEELDPSTIEDAATRALVIQLLKLLENALQQVQALKEEVQLLRDENNRLKGEQGKPDVPPNTPATNYSSSPFTRPPKKSRVRDDKGKLAAWLRVRPLLELVSRDRSPEYARAFEKGHPRRCK